MSGTPGIRDIRAMSDMLPHTRVHRTYPTCDKCRLSRRAIAEALRPCDAASHGAWPSAWRAGTNSRRSANLRLTPRHMERARPLAPGRRGSGLGAGTAGDLAGPKNAPRARLRRARVAVGARYLSRGYACERYPVGPFRACPICPPRVHILRRTFWGKRRAGGALREFAARRVSQLAPVCPSSFWTRHMRISCPKPTSLLCNGDLGETGIRGIAGHRCACGRNYFP
jgi:hypothetical protein